MSPLMSVLLLLTLTFPARLSPASQSAQVALGFISRLDSLVTTRVASDSFSGVVVVAKHGATIYERAAGMANRELQIPMTLETRLQIASTTKLFTQIAIRQLEQAGKLSLSDTVGQFLPSYPNVTVRRKVTVDQLLHHRSGVGSFWNAQFMARHASIRNVADYLGLFQDDSLLFEPGTSQAYSNGGYVLLGAIIERVSGESYHQYVRMHIFAPAGMTGTMPYDSRVPTINSATGYTTQLLGEPSAGDTRLAGPGARPGYAPPADADRTIVRRPTGTVPDSSVPSSGLRLRILGGDGRELSPNEARAAVAERAAGNHPRHPNSATEAGMSGPAGDDYSTAQDFINLAHALTSHLLLDSARTVAVLGPRFAAGGDYRANGGGPGVNAEFSIFPTGEVLIVLSNYDPPAATVIAQFVRDQLAAHPDSPAARR